MPSIFLLPLLVVVGATVYGTAMRVLVPDFVRQVSARFGLR
jgi:hypothetical protein